jgi:hypothetical protein
MSNAMPSFPLCSQCGFSHPEIPQGQKCSLAKTPMSQEEKNIESEVGTLVLQMKNIIMSKISQKGIKDTKKLVSFSIVEFTKLLETYKE